MIYAIRAGTCGPIKIGSSDDPTRRLYECQVAHWEVLDIIGVASGGEKEELSIHDTLADDCIRGEWFYPTRRVLDLVAATFRPMPRPEPKIDVRNNVRLNKLKKWMSSEGVSGEELARRIGITGRALRRYWSGERTPTVDVVRKIYQETSGAVTANDFVHGLEIDQPSGPEGAPQ